MKNLVFLCSLALILFLLSCNQNEPTSPEGDNQQSGKLFLKIDKANAPESVVWIEAFLTREGYDTISGIMNLLSDSTADLLLENIQAGEWHLRVDAEDSTEVVLYTGETDVQVFAGFTTQVNLILEPTGSGVGNIYLWVTWGVPPIGNWVDYSGNPVLSPSGTYYETHGVGQGVILNINDVYKMWYLGDAGANLNFVMYAESNDGINWMRPYSDPVLSPGVQGSWDDLSVHPGAIIYDDGQYKMYYCGWSNTYGPWHIGLATSGDGINWVKYPIPVLYAGDDMEFQLAPSSIIKIDDVFYLYYTGRNLPYLDIRVATSLDGINWTKYNGNPILTYDKPWEGTGVYYPSVYKNDNLYIMIFMNQLGDGFGRATSTDAINWTKDESNPFFTNEETHNHWANYKITYPYFIKVNNKDRIYYTGFYSYESPYKIGFITR
jgi:predicted GH43/DUF377 family glycosyl hydrolase